jgi:F0F1-type ATP synthase membrane subunit b/b'
MLNAETFVAFGFILFVGLLAYLGVHKSVNAALDKRADRIKSYAGIWVTGVIRRRSVTAFR